MAVRELPVFRATTVLIALIVAAGPMAGLLCRSWCTPQVAAATGCHDTDAGPGPRLAAGDGCDDLVLGAPSAVLPEGARRAASGATQQAVLAAGLAQGLPNAFESGSPGAARFHQRLTNRPLSTHLRI